MTPSLDKPTRGKGGGGTAEGQACANRGAKNPSAPAKIHLYFDLANNSERIFIGSYFFSNHHEMIAVHTQFTAAELYYVMPI